MGEKRLVGNARRKKPWIINACFSILGDECLGDCQESNRAGLIANTNECCSSLAFLSTAKKAFFPIGKRAGAISGAMASR